MSDLTDEFNWIERLRALTRGDRRALDLRDDVAILPSRPGYDLVITKDAMVEGVHVLDGEQPDIIARRLLRTNLSDLAAKAAEPFGYFLMTAWPASRGTGDREAFAHGLARDGEAFGLALLGGDTVSTAGPLTVSATMLGWVPAGGAILRSTARAGDALVVCGVVGDGWLGLQAARGLRMDHARSLAGHYRLPKPWLALRAALRDRARAAADISDGLLADAAHIATASRLGLELDLAGLPLSMGAAAWLDGQPDRASALVRLASGGDDYALACAVDPRDVARFSDEVLRAGCAATRIGRFRPEPGLRVTLDGARLTIDHAGWRH